MEANREIRTLREFLTGSWAILGIGNELRGDDGFGSIVARRLREALAHQDVVNRIFVGGVAPENFWGKISRLQPEKLLVIDAVVFDGAPGEVRFLRPEELAAPFQLTHGPSNFAVMQMVLPGTEIVVLSAMPKRTAIGDKLSPEVERAIDLVCEEIEEVLTK